MKKTVIKLAMSAAVVSLWALDLSPSSSYLPRFSTPAGAVVGRPLTPVSAAGVARRTTRRAVYATSASQQQAQQQQQEAQAQQASASALPKGTVVTALPSGCSSVTVEGVSMFSCGGTIYQPKFQGSQLVYVVM